MARTSQTKIQNGIEQSLYIQIKGRLRAWTKALHHSWRSALKIDRSQLVVATALRSAFGLALPLTIGVMTGHVIEGVSIAGGAATLGAVGLTFTYRARTRLLLLASLGIAASALVGSLTGRIDWLAILLAGIWGFGAGMLVSISQASMIIGLQSVVALIVLSHFSLSPSQSVLQAMLMFIGALLQTGLGLIPLPGYSFGPERAALSTVYQVLADRAENSSQPFIGRQINEALTKAEATLADSNPDTPRGKAFANLFDRAKHIHLELIILAEVLQRLEESNNENEQAENIELLQQILSAASTILRAVGFSLHTTHLTTSLIEPQQQIERAIALLRQQASTGEKRDMLQHALIYSATLRQQLLEVEEITRSWRNKRGHNGLHIPHKPEFRLQDPLATLRTNLTLRSTACRHAIRLGITLAIATAIYHLFPFERGYWIPLTALLVLKPDFTSTFSRGVARLIGTIFGALLTTLIVSKLAPTPATLVVLDTIAAFLSFALLNVNYAIFSAFITAEVIFLLTFVDPQPLTNIAGRTLDTVIGGTLALLTYVLWPTWEHTQAHYNIARRIEALNHYFTALIKAYRNPDHYDLSTIENARKEARLARSNAEASVERLQNEPVHHHLTPNVARGLLATTDRLAQSLLSLEAYLQDIPLHHPLPALENFSQEVSTALDTLATAVRNTKPEAQQVDLHKTLHTLKRAKGAAEDVTHAEMQFVCSEASTIVDSIDTMNRLLSTNQYKTVQLVLP